MSEPAKKESTETGESPQSQIEDLLRRVDALPTLDSRPESEILGYGDDGLPHGE